MKDRGVGGGEEMTSEGDKSVEVSLPPTVTMRVLLLICMPVLLLAQGQYEEPFPLLDYVPDYFPESPDTELPDSLPGTFQQQVRLHPVVRPEKTGSDVETEPTEPGPLDCREEQYPCTRLYSVHKPCKQCLNSLCFYSLRRVYVINREVCVRTVCAHEELLRADLCRDQFSRCGVAALSGQCASLGGSCGKSCGGC
ncbi:microfibrillar-associated protein 2 isoform X1 [Solea solea]|uniref:microfibrillar-associated protein 2 isoform X1 n=1 Tax=Solea solea TaxID=90069 RepID=UPI002729722B|nr:microfibrillar-associated protein 2 isoform X1 [Solea solea]